MEQIYPFPNQQIKEVFKTYAKAKTFIWCQEEPQNQGAWYQSKHHFTDNLSSQIALYYAGRDASASPAVGHFHTHIEQQKAVVNTAIYGNPSGKLK